MPKDGDLAVDTSDGSMHLDGRFDDLQVKAGDGSVEVTLPKDLKADIDASSGDGHVSSDIPLVVQGNFSKSRVHGKLNGGGGAVSIHTGDGSIRLREG